MCLEQYTFSLKRNTVYSDYLQVLGQFHLNIVKLYLSTSEIPPENYKYASIDAFSEIENEFQNVRKKYKYVCLYGDFNNRTSEEPDCINIDRESCNNENVEHYICNIS